MDDRNAQEAVGRGQLGERVMTVPLLPFPVDPGSLFDAD